MTVHSEPIRVGVIGCGNVSLSDHVPAYLALSDQYRLVAIADPTPARLELGRQLSGLDPADCHAASASLLARPDLDLIDVCTPQHLHRDLAIAAASSGRHVLSEKPLATTPRDAWAMVAAAEAAGRTLAIMHNYLLFNEVVRTLELIAAGEIGPVEVAILNWLAVRDNPGNAAYRPTWRHDVRQSGGGVLMDMLHIVYLAEAFLGAPIERVSAWVTARTDEAPVEDIAMARFETATNAALVNVGWGVGMGGFAVSGPIGRIEVSYEDGGNGAFDPFERLIVHGRSGRFEETELPWDDGVRPLIAELGEAIRAGRPPIASGAQGAHILEATLAVYASAATGTTWDLPLQPGTPIYELGVAGLAELDLAPSSPIRRKRIFGVA
ncbi:MAG: Gfo/Idh/MocA family oxidoreductase [Chloroflexota bacterium]|nr:Gfo/Idh/MocA family oxidoreductase [Chloroflexota bacterium]